MVQPINYMAQIPQPDLARSLLSGLQLGTSIREMQEKRVATEQAQLAKQQYSTDLQQVLQNPSMKAFNEFSLKYPQQREAVKDVASRFTQEQQDAEFNIGRDIAVSLENNNPDIALNIVNQAIEARKNSNLPTTVYDQIQQILSNTDDPERIKKAQRQTNFSLTLLNPEKFGKVVESLEKQKLTPEDGFKILTEAERTTAKLPEGVYQRGPKGEIKLLSASKEQFKLLTPAEVKAAGLPAGSYQQGPSGEIKTVVKEPLVVIGDQSKRDTLALKELDVPRAQEFSAAAASARTLARDSRVISNLLKGKGGGAVIKLGTDIAKNLGFTTDTVVANDLANSLAVRGATQLRPPGSGSTSDIEFRAFVSAFPSLANSEDGRELMAKYADAFAKRSAKIADHARKLIRADNYSEEEIARFDENLGPILADDFYSQTRQGRRANVPVYTPPAAAPVVAPAAAPASATQAPRTVDSVLQQYLRP